MGGVGGQSVSASVALVRLTAHFIFGLNFIAKVYHNQNFMLAPPLSSVGLETTLFGFRMKLKSLNLLSRLLSALGLFPKPEEEEEENISIRFADAPKVLLGIVREVMKKQVEVLLASRTA